MDIYLDSFLRNAGLTPPDADEATMIVSRLLIAALFGAILGYERERQEKAAGLRTHMLVALGAALFTLVPILVNPDNPEMGQIVKGIAAGVGFLGAGAILKRKKNEVEGITTAAGIWLAAAVGLSVGAGKIWPAGVGTLLSWMILALARQDENVNPDEQDDSMPSQV